MVFIGQMPVLVSELKC